MKYKKISFDNYDIYYINTKKFKTIQLTTILINDFKEEDITKEKVITELLVSTNKEYNTEVSLSKRIMELYEPRFDIVDIFNDKHLKILDMNFLNEKYTEPGMNKETIDFYYSLYFKPNIKDNSFEKNNFDMTINRIKSFINLDKEDPKMIAYTSMIKHIKDDVPFRIDDRIKLKDLKEINNKDLYSYHKNRIKSSKVIVVLTGDINEDIINIVRSNLDSKVYKNEKEFKKEYDLKPVKKEGEFIKTSKSNQSILYMIYKMHNLTKREKNIVLPIFNDILGGSSSKLFNNVREKNSLAYYAYSNFATFSGILYLYAGITNSNYKKTVEIMKEQVNDMIKGNITDIELNNSIESLCSSIYEKEDRISSINQSLSYHILYDLIMMDEKIEKYKSVTKEELVELGSKLELDFVFLLKGDN